MNKAFTRETDEDDAVIRPRSALPPGARNLITPAGARAMGEQLHELERQRARMAAVDTDAQTADRRRLDRELRELRERIATLHIVEPIAADTATVRFGATVRVVDQSDTGTSYTIVGVDEADAARGRISWISPVATALLRRSVGDVVRLSLPDGTTELEIIAIDYAQACG